MTQAPLTVDEARKILGKKAEKMTDQQIVEVLNVLRLLCQKSIEATVKEDCP